MTTLTENAVNTTEQSKAPSSSDSFCVERIRQDFPILSQKIHQSPLVYLDNAATTQKPQVVIDTINTFYSEQNANVHRGLHTLSEQATFLMEQSRSQIANFINAPSPQSLIFTKGTTDGLNLLASSLTQLMTEPGKEVIITHMEHHANIVPWQLACQRVGATIKVVRMHENGELDLDHFQSLLSANTAVVSFTAIANSLGTVNPCHDIIRMIREHPECSGNDVAIIIDGAQAVAHQKVDVQALDCDFFVFSAHKIFGPTGVGGLYGKPHWLDRLPPYQGGGDMIREVRFEGSTFAPAPQKFEAGTPAIAQAIGFGQAIEYLAQIDLTAAALHEQQLLERMTERLQEQPHTKIIGQAKHKAGVVSFVCEEVHPHDLGTLLDFEGVAIRAGHHCSMPVMDYYKVAATTRASVALYNTMDEVDYFCDALLRVRKHFK